MAHIDLRALDDDDLDAVYTMLTDAEAVKMAAFTAPDAADRASFDEWIARERTSPDVSLHVVTERGGFAGIVAAFTVGSDREVTCWLARHAWGRGVGAEALRLLVSREPARPLFARAAAGDERFISLLRRLGFAEISRSVQYAPGVDGEVEEVVFALAPAVE